MDIAEFPSSDLRCVDLEFRLGLISGVQELPVGNPVGDDLNPLDEWVMFQVEAVVQGSAVTVFARSAPEYPTLHNDVYWDEASLTVIAPAPAPTPAPNRYFSYCGEGVGESQPRVPALTR